MFVCMPSFVSEANNFPEKENYMILVEQDKDKAAYADLAYFKSARFNVELVSLADIGIKYQINEYSIREKLRNYLISRSGSKDAINPIKYLLLDDAITPRLAEAGGGERGFWSDYPYAFLNHNYYVSDADYILTYEPEFPEIIVSRMEQKQLKYWDLKSKAKKMSSVHATIANPIVCYRQIAYTSSGCRISAAHIDHSYYGDYIKDVFAKKKINATTLYETRYSKISSEQLKVIKPIKKPDLSLNADNFRKTLIRSNLVLLGYTIERVNLAEKTMSVYREDFVTSIWEDKNKNYLADDDAEITIENILPYSEMNKDNLKRFYFVPHGGLNIVGSDFPISIRPKFDYFDVPIPHVLLFLQEGYDPEGSCMLTIYNGILREIANGVPFALANLKGYRNYAVYLKDKKDPSYQAPNAVTLFCYGPPDETILDLLPEPYLKIEDNQQINPRNTKIEVANLGEKPLNYKIVDWSKNIEVSNTFYNIGVQPGEKGEINFKIKYNFSYTYAVKPQKKTAWIIITTNDRFWPKKKIDFFWY